jgi:hypothetical protein
MVSAVQVQAVPQEVDEALHKCNSASPCVGHTVPRLETEQSSHAAWWHLLLQVQAVPQEVDEALHKWADRTPALAAIKGAAADKAAAAAAGGGSNKGAKDEKSKKKKK